MLEPQSMVFLVLLVVAFAAMMWGMIVARRLVIRIVLAFLAFVPAMMFGVAMVNKYFDYYQTWGSAVADITNQGVPGVARVSLTTASHPGAGPGLLPARYANSAAARQQGLTLQLTVRGQSSQITRTVFVFLPPQYFWPGFYQHYRFPAIELIHGFPGKPQDWITVLGVNSAFDTLLSERTARPAVLVMPDANGGRGVSLQCLNQAGGPQDATFLARDLPAYISGGLRVQPPGAGWGIAGYSEGGFCAANLGLQQSSVFSYAGIMSGYFRPSDNQLVNPTRQVSPFGGNSYLAQVNNPLGYLRSLSTAHPIARFWLGAGLLDIGDVRNAETFGQLVRTHQPSVTISFVPGGHDMATWRQLLPPMLRWMTQGLARHAALRDPQAAGRQAAIMATAHSRVVGQQPAQGYLGHARM